MVHLGLLWVEVEPAAVEINCSLEVFGIPVASDSPFDGHDFTVYTFCHCVGNSMGAIANDVGQSVLNGSRKLLHGLELGVDHSPVPVFEIGGRFGRGVVPPEVSK